MQSRPYLAVYWRTDDSGVLRAFEPKPGQLAPLADRLAGYYNEPYNRSMMSNETVMSPSDVLEHWERLAREGGRPFLLERDGVLVGDADFRHLEPPTAEFAIMIGERAIQGRGLGLRFAVMLHALGFSRMHLERVYAAIIAENHASQRLFAKLGYQPDSKPDARRYAEAGDDLTFSLTRERFAQLHGDSAARVSILQAI